MAKKLQQFQIFKFDSDRLKEKKYKIDITVEEAGSNGEIVSISDSQLVRTLHRITNREFSNERLENLLMQKKAIAKRKNSHINRVAIQKVFDEINDLLFISEIISVQFKDKRHFKDIVAKGLYINGESFVYFMSSAGQTRRDQALFVKEKFKDLLESIFNNDRDMDVPLIPQKFSAYYSLYSSSSQEVSFPRIAFVKDVVISAKKKVDFSTYVSPLQDPIISEEEKVFDFNGADGQGIMTPQYAQRIAYELELDESPSAAIIRAPFLKGLLCTFDLVDFADRVANTDTFIDLYGNPVNINDVDVLISESQFKLWASYSSTQAYVEACKKNGLGFGVSRTSQNDKTFARSSYQFIQVLSLDEKDIEELCQPTVKWLSDISGNDIASSILFLLGESDFEKGWFDRLDAQTKALLIDNGIINDSYFVDYIGKNISKKKEEAKLGKLIFSGNYSFMVADPFAQVANVFGLGLTPLLNEGEHYCNFWRERGVGQVAAVRSPIIHSSEINVLNLQDNDDVNHWYQFLNKSCVVFPLNGVGLDFAIQGGADVDGDLICTINHPSFIKGRIESLPIMYDAKKAGKVKLDKDYDDILIHSQIRQVRSNKIGFYTNLCSSLQSMLCDFPKDSKEHQTILNRLKYFRVLQGNAIDSTKGIEVDPFLEYWAKRTKITEDMSEEEKAYWEFNNKLVAKRRPSFFVNLYGHYKKEYAQEMSFFNNISRTDWRIRFEDLLKMKREERTADQNELVDYYHQVSFFISNNSVMNRVSEYISRMIKEIKATRRRASRNFDYTCMLSKDFKEPSKAVTEKFVLLYKTYKSLKREFRNNYANPEKNTFVDINQIFKSMNEKAYATISSNAKDLGDLAIYCTHNSNILGKQSQSFAWQVFGDEIVNNMLEKTGKRSVSVYLPMKNGMVEYLWRRYSSYGLDRKD